MLGWVGFLAFLWCGCLLWQISWLVCCLACLYFDLLVGIAWCGLSPWLGGVVAARLGWVCACRLVFRASCAILGAGCFGVTCLLLGGSSVVGSVWRLRVVA